MVVELKDVKCKVMIGEQHLMSAFCSPILDTKKNIIILYDVFIRDCFYEKYLSDTFSIVLESNDITAIASNCSIDEFGFMTLFEKEDERFVSIKDLSFNFEALEQIK